LSRFAARPLGVSFRLSPSMLRPAPCRFQLLAQLLILSTQALYILLGLLQTLAQNFVFLFQFLDSLEGWAMPATVVPPAHGPALRRAPPELSVRSLTRLSFC